MTVPAPQDVSTVAPSVAVLLVREDSSSLMGTAKTPKITIVLLAAQLVTETLVLVVKTTSLPTTDFVSSTMESPAPQAARSATLPKPVLFVPPVSPSPEATVFQEPPSVLPGVSTAPTSKNVKPVAAA